MASFIDSFTGWLGQRLGRYLSRARHGHEYPAPADPARLLACIRRGDVLLVEGQSRVSVAIKYLTQSTWSHAALYAGPDTGLVDEQDRPRCFLEADISEGVRAVTVAEYAGLHCRICRPVGLSSGDPTRAICSTLIAQAFQSVRYPILPDISTTPANDPLCPGCMDEILHVRHHSLFVPRDFDVSPYFCVIKPTLAAGFDPHQLAWHDRSPQITA